MNPICVAMAFLLAGTAVLAQDGNPWEELAGSGSLGGITNVTGTKRADGTSMAVDAAGNPVIAFVWDKTTSNRFQTVVMRWNPDPQNPRWEELPGSVPGNGISNSANFTAHASLALEPDGDPVVAWTDLVNKAIYVLRWDGALRAWFPYRDSSGRDSNAGTGINETGSPVVPQLALDSAGRPAVAWINSTLPTPQVCFRQWDGLRWKELDGSGGPAGLSFTGAGHQAASPRLALDGDGRPTVAWLATAPSTAEGLPGSYRIRLARWNGEDWTGWGPSMTGDGVEIFVPTKSTDTMSGPALALDAEGRPVVAFSSTVSGRSQVYVRRWDGEAWAPMMQFQSAEATQAEWGAWRPSLVLDGGGAPVIAWEEEKKSLGGARTVGHEIFLRRWNGDEWEALGNSAYGGGISEREVHSLAPCLASNRRGDLGVAWTLRNWLASATDPYRWDACFRRRVNLEPRMGPLTQRRADGLVVPPGGSSNAIRLEAPAYDDNPEDRVHLEIQVVEATEAFDGAAVWSSAEVPSGRTVIHEPADLSIDTSYHWRARVKDGHGGESDWSAPVSFRYAANLKPEASGAGQFDPVTGDVIAAGARAYTTGRLRFRGRGDDADFDTLRWQVEIQPIGSPFSGSPTAASDWVESGEETGVEAEVPFGACKWRGRFVDSMGGASDWIDFGGNGDEADFHALPFGSAGGPFGCGGSAPGGTRLLPAAVVLLLALRRRRP